MYNGSTRRTPDEDDRRRRESQVSYSPTHSHPFSPKLNGSSQQSPVSAHRNMASSTRYDPLFEHRDSKGGHRTSHSHAYSPPHGGDLAYEHLEGKSSRKSSHSYTQSPTQVSVDSPCWSGSKLTPSQAREPLPSYKSYQTSSKSPPTSFQSPTEAHFPQRSPQIPTTHAHPVSRHSSTQYSPEKHSFDQPTHAHGPGLGIYGHVKTNGHGDPPSSQETIDEEPPLNHSGIKEEKTPAKRSDPMSFSNILSSGPPDPPKPVVRATPASRVFKNSSSVPDGETKARPAPRKSQSKNSSSKAASSSAKTLHKGEAEMAGLVTGSLTNGKSNGNAKRKSSILLQKENELVKMELAKIDAMELSDLDSPEFVAAKESYIQSSKKRQLDVENAELPKRKVSLRPTTISVNDSSTDTS